jgi:hypothetical protein
MDFDKQLFEELIKMFLDGKSDGSVRDDMEISQLAFSSVFTAAGFFQMLSLSGNTYTKHFGLDRDSFIKLTIEMMVDSLRKRYWRRHAPERRPAIQILLPGPSRLWGSRPFAFLQFDVRQIAKRQGLQSP